MTICYNNKCKPKDYLLVINESITINSNKTRIFIYINISHERYESESEPIVAFVIAKLDVDLRT